MNVGINLHDNFWTARDNSILKTVTMRGFICMQLKKQMLQSHVTFQTSVYDDKSVMMDLVTALTVYVRPRINVHALISENRIFCGVLKLFYFRVQMHACRVYLLSKTKCTPIMSYSVSHSVILLST